MSFWDNLQDFLRQHKEVVIKTQEPQETLFVEKEVCGVLSSTIDPPGLFNNLDPNCKPIATPSRDFGKRRQKRIGSSAIIRRSRGKVTG